MSWPNLQGIKVLAVDDDETLCEMIQAALETAGAEVRTSTSGEEALRLFEASPPDVVLLDVMMPVMDGIEVCRRMLRIADVPIILVTVLSGEDSTVRGLVAGAIDYVPKPFSVKVLAARVCAAARRVGLPAGERRRPYDDGYLQVDLANRNVLVMGERVKLTPIEHRLLALLLETPGCVIAVEQILDEVWGSEYADSPNYVHVYVSRLRAKLDPPSREHTYFDNVRGHGYRFVPRSS